MDRPGQKALENMSLLKSDSTVFKVPKIPKLKKREKKRTKTTKFVVLEEELYINGIAKIIERDFFPDLEKLKVQNDFLEATENKDYARLRQITQKYSGGCRPPTEPYASPATFDTPTMDRPYSPAAPDKSQKSNQSENQEAPKEKDITDNQSLDSFLSKHTSEDNASYDRVIALEDRRRCAKLTDQFEAEITAGALADAALRLPSIEEQADQTDRPKELDTWRYQALNYIMYVPEGGKSQKPPPKPELQHQNTRLRADPFDHAKNQETITAIAKTQVATVSGRIGVDGTCVGKGQKEYDFVSTPSPRPGDGPDQSPLMTWGEIEGTPFRLDGGDTPLPGVGAGAAYHMLEGGTRERIGLELAEKVAKKRRPTTPRITAVTPSFRTNTERIASMSPAARKLAAKHLKSPRHKLTPNYLGIFSHAATPKLPKTRTPTPQRSLVATPKTLNKLATLKGNVDSASTNNNSSLENDNITDNLLQINVAKRDRMTAIDFFN